MPKISEVAFQRYYKTAIKTPARQFVPIFLHKEKEYLLRKKGGITAADRLIIQGKFDNILRNSAYSWQRKMIEHALKVGDKAPYKVMKDYPDLIPDEMLVKVKGLPKSTQVIHFNVLKYGCYPKKKGKNVRVYCRWINK